jgi:two-component system chemotaxis sensor kinase CheA
MIAAEGRRVALIVDDYVGEQEVLVRPLGRRFGRLPHIAGGTFLPGGRMGLILNAPALVRTAHKSAPAPIAAEAPPAATQRVLLADDSLTTRSLERSILEVAGYDVIAAADGEEAWRLLQENGADIVVSDVEMPLMDGFALTQAIRGSKRFADVPVILVTTLASDADKLRGLQAGASAYLVKNAFDEKSLLDAIGQLL